MTRKFMAGVIVLTALMAGCARGPATVAKTFAQDIARGDTQGAINQVSPSVFQMLPQAKIQASLQEAGRKAAARGGIAKLTTLSVAINGQTAVVELQTTYGDGSVQRDRYDLVKEGSSWKITFDPSRK